MKPTPPAKKRGRPRGSKPALPIDEIMATPQHTLPVPFADDECPPEWYDEVRQRQIDAGAGKMSIEFTKPKQCAVALWRMAQGVHQWRIAEETGLNLKTIVNLKWKHHDTLDSRRKEISKSYAHAADAFTELLMEKANQLGTDPAALAKISPEKLALTIGIMTDKAAQLSGMAGVIIEHRKGPSIEDASQAIAAAKARIADKLRATAIEAEVIETQEETAA
jgi:hypothetical protein